MTGNTTASSQRTFIVAIVITFVVLLACVLGAMWTFRTLELESRDRAQLERARYEDGRKLERLAQVVEAFRAKRGALPESIDTLRAPDALEFFGSEPFDALFLDAWGQTFRIESTATGFRVFTLGRDDQVGGEGVDADQFSR